MNRHMPDNPAADERSAEQLVDSLLACHRLSIASERFKCTPDALSPEQQHEVRQIALRQMLIEDAVLSSPEASGVIVPPAVIQQALAQLQERFRDAEGQLDQEALQAEMQRHGLDETDIEAALARQLRVECVLDRVCAALPAVSDTDARLFYYLHIDEFKLPERRVARHILITINNDFPENTREQALARISAIARRLRRKPERFAEQALKHSECPTSLQGGLLGTVSRGMLFPELDSCLFRLRPGEVSEVIESSLGFHVLLCDCIQPAHTAAIEEVLPRLLEQLDERQRRRARKRWLHSLLNP